MRRSSVINRAVLLGVLLLAYAGSYFVTSRLSLAEARREELSGFFYVPVSKLSAPVWQRIHEVLAIIYWPAHAFDFYLLNGPPVGTIPTYDFISASTR